MVGSKVSPAGSGSTTTGLVTLSVPVLVVTRLMGATSPGPMRLSGPFDSDSVGVPSVTVTVADAGGMANVVPEGCNWDSPAASEVLSKLAGIGEAGFEANVWRTLTRKHTVAFGHPPLVG